MKHSPNSLTHSLAHSLTHSLTRSLTHSLAHSLTEYGYKGNKTLKRGGGDRAAG